MAACHLIYECACHLSFRAAGTRSRVRAATSACTALRTTPAVCTSVLLRIIFILLVQPVCIHCSSLVHPLCIPCAFRVHIFPFTLRYIPYASIVHPLCTHFSSLMHFVCPHATRCASIMHAPPFHRAPTPANNVPDHSKHRLRDQKTALITSLAAAHRGEHRRLCSQVATVNEDIAFGSKAAPFNPPRPLLAPGRRRRSRTRFSGAFLTQATCSRSATCRLASAAELTVLAANAATKHGPNHFDGFRLGRSRDR